MAASSFYQSFPLNLFTTAPKESITLKSASILSPIARLELESEELFQDSDLRKADNNGAFAVCTITKFDVSIRTHGDFIARCTAAHTEYLNTVIGIDTKAFAYFVVSAVVAPWIPFIGGLLGTAALIAAVYYVAQHSAAYNEQQAAGTLLAKACNWSLGEAANADLMTNLHVKQMIKELGGVLDKEELTYLTANAIDRTVTRINEDDATRSIASGAADTQTAPQRSTNLNQEEIECVIAQSINFTRCLYGINKGDVASIASAGFTAIPDLFRIIMKRIKPLIEYCNDQYATLNKL